MERKKSSHQDIYRKTSLFFNLGLIFSIGLVISAFEWQSSEQEVIVEPQILDGDIYVDPYVLTPEVREDNLPPKPLPVKSVTFEATEDKNLMETTDINIDNETSDVMAFGDIPELEEEIIPEWQPRIEVLASFDGGYEGWARFLRKHLKYPAKARRLGIEGKVTLTFVIDKDGSVTDITVLNGIGAGCDEEAIRVLSKSPRWNPAQQLGRPIKTRMSLPVVFRLSSPN